MGTQFTLTFILDQLYEERGDCPKGGGILGALHQDPCDLPAPLQGKEASTPALAHLLVVGCFNVCDWDLLEFLSCPPQRALLSWNWRVNAAIRRKILGKVVLIFVFQLKKKKNIV